MNKFYSIAILLAWAISSSCAGSYKNINPNQLKYTSTSTTNTDMFEAKYQYNVLESSGNRKYKKKEEKGYIDLVAVQLTNYGTDTLEVGRDIHFFSGDKSISMINDQVLINEFKQRPLGYLLYLGLIPVNFTYTDGFTVNSYRVGLILGPGLALGNFALAASANTSFTEEIKKYSLQGRRIAPNETVVGIIGVPKNNYAPISVKIGRVNIQ